MNIGLYNLLMNAKYCLQQNKRYDNEIGMLQKEIEGHKYFLETITNVRKYRDWKEDSFLDKAGRFFSKRAFPEFDPSTEGCLYVVIHYLYIFPIVATLAILFYLIYGILYFLLYPLIKKIELKKDQKSQSDFEKDRQLREKQIPEKERRIAELQIEKRELNKKLGYPLARLYKGYRREDAVDYMIKCVKNYSVNSVEEVQEMLRQHYITMDEIERQQEERMERERQHQETQEALEAIARNQERIANDLERYEQERKTRW